MTTDGAAPRHTNRLAQATSPYLLQHAHNPVDWYPWGEEALQRARDEDKPILLSIGYSACHWCHVMERESFENEEIAAQMNAAFVCVKVDREERPDLDEIYMAATQAMNQGQGGWPMTVFLTPEKEPFFTGTYFPPKDAYGRPGFPTVLARLSELWRTQRARVREQAGEVAGYLRQSVVPTPGTSLGEDQLRSALKQYTRDFDETHGGFGGAPKFPPALALMLLLRLFRRFGDGHALEMVKATLDGMAMGGMYDQVGGGFHRYSVDAFWLVPHFEKMLYDNALLVRAYLEGYQASGDPFYARIAREVLDYVLREMTAPSGGFYSATDADSEGEEGRFFVWTPAQVEEALGDAEAARRFCAYYDITPTGNWEGHSIPNTTTTGERMAAALGLSPEELERDVAASRARLYEARQRRVPPALDDKVLTSWNALMIGALAEASRVLDEPRYRAAAERAARFVLEALREKDGRLLRTWRAGRAQLPAYLEDYAFLGDALVDLYEAGGSVDFLGAAEELAGHLRALFAGEDGAFFSTAKDHEALILRHREGNDGAVPSANGVAARLLARLSFHLDRPQWREEALSALRAWGRSLEHHPRAFAGSLMTVEMLMDGPVELAFVGAEGEDLTALRREVAQHFLPQRIIGHHDPAGGASALPLLQDKTTVGGRAALYVCRDFSCQRPVTAASDVAAALAAAGPPLRPTVLAAPRLPGAATAEGTRRYAARHEAAAGAFRALSDTGLTVGAVGFGSYRVDEGVPLHEQALRAALRAGCNLLDTSTNYADGGSERLIGQVLAQLVREGALAREEVVVVSKIGYLQGRNHELALEREEKGAPFPEVVKYGDGIWHCLHPEFIAEQLGRSLDRLGLAALDVCLLHNPEYFLKDAHERSHGPLERRRQEFQRRLVQAFRQLEAEVAAGRIRWYGVSSNTITAPARDPEGTSVEALLKAAAAAGGATHHFRVLQLPLNLLEAGAALVPNTGAHEAQTALELAAARGLAVLANRPLNAIVDGVIVRLAHPQVPDAPEVEAQALKVAALEEEFRRDIVQGARLRTAEGSAAPDDLFRWAEDLREAAAQVKTLEHWDELEAHRIMPRVAQVLQALDRSLSGPVGERWHAWRDAYLPELQVLLAACRRRAALRSHEASAQVAERLAPLLPAERRHEPLSRLALWTVASTPGVTTTLVGMRHPEYVADALTVLQWEPLPDARAVYAALATGE